ncbi:MAG: hypothetical protein WBG10_00395 [Pseudolabrys sp.]
MFHSRVSIAAIALMSAMVVTASAQMSAPTPAAPAPTASKIKLTREKLREMRAKWSSNKPKLKSCRVEARKKGLVDDDRWFFIEDCMGKS